MPTEPPMASSKQEQLVLFARNFVKHPRMLGSVIPSSRFLIERLLRRVDWEQARVLVEYGPGVGTFTEEIVRRMHPEASLVVLETNPDFVAYLRRTLRDERVHVVNRSAADVERVLSERGLAHADYVLSGIPFSTLPDKVREDILHSTRKVLRPDGLFLVYQFSPKVLGDLRRVFTSVERGFEPLNVPPAQLFFCRRT